MKPETKRQILITGLMGTATAFLSTSLLMAFCMLPAVVAYIIDRTPQKSKAFCVGVLNFAGTLPFVLELWRQGQDVSAALEILRQPKTIVTAYSIAACGYVLEYAVADIVGRILIQKSIFRIREIEKRQEDLITRWDQYVDGLTPLDDYGFPLDRPKPKL